MVLNNLVYTIVQRIPQQVVLKTVLKVRNVLIFHSYNLSTIMSGSVNDMLKFCIKVDKPAPEPDIFQSLLNKSNKFPISFPIETVKCKNLVAINSQDVICQNIVSTYPLMHEDVLKLACSFILYKRSHGFATEKALYKEMDVISFIDRLLKKRSITFYSGADVYILHTKQRGSGGWEKVGTDSEVPPLLLENCLSYDEMRLSAMLYVSGPTIFINDGNRYNVGAVSDAANIEQHGIIIGLIGTRFEVDSKMEYEDMVIDRKQNAEVKGYGDEDCDESNLSDSAKKLREWRKIWTGFYRLPRLTFYEASKMHRELDSKDKKVFDNHFILDSEKLFDVKTYSTHLSKIFDCTLLEANRRGTANDKMSYLHVVGIGLGVWKKFTQQSVIFVKTFLDRIRTLAPQLCGISDVHFAYFRDIDEDVLTKKGLFIDCPTHPLGGIQVHLSKREPSRKLTGAHQGKLLVETYAWDGNAQPGNEFWAGSLQGSGDPAAACSSQVAELHNSLINTTYVCGNNLHIAGKHGLHHVSNYVSLMLGQRSE